MVRLPVLSAQKIIQFLRQEGFFEARQKGSHKRFRHEDGRSTTVPFHLGQDLSPILLRQILRDIEVTPQEFLSKK